MKRNHEKNKDRPHLIMKILTWVFLTEGLAFDHQVSETNDILRRYI